MTRWTYLGIADELEARIRRGEWRPGDKLPTHTQLGNEYKVSYQTVAKAIALLKDRGLVVSSPPLGVYVADD